MNTMRMTCPSCGTVLKVQNDWIGMQITCSQCNASFIVPSHQQSQTEVKQSNGNYQQKHYFDEVKSTTSCASPSEQIPEKFHPEAISFFWDFVLGILLIPAFGLGIFLILATIINIKFTIYELRPDKIIFQKGMLNRSRKELWIKDIREVELRQGLWHRCVNTGHVVVYTAAATSGNGIFMYGIKNPDELIKKINSLRGKSI